MLITCLANLGPIMLRMSWATRVCSLRVGGGRGWPVEGLSEKLEGGLRSFTSWKVERPGEDKEGGETNFSPHIL